MGPALPAADRLEGLRSDQRDPDPDRAREGRGRPQSPRRHPDERDDLRRRRRRDAVGRRQGRAPPAVTVVNLTELEALARARLPTMTWDYYASGADDEACVRRNLDAFARIVLHHRVLV